MILSHQFNKGENIFMKTNRKKAAIAISIIIAALICIQLMTNCSSSKQTLANVSEGAATKSVIAMSAASESYVSSLKYKGYVTAKEEKKLSFGLSGKVKGVYVEKGQQVQAGDLIAEMDTASIMMAIDSANQNIRITQNSITQIQNSVSQIDSGIESGKLTLESLQIGLEAEELNLQKIRDSYETKISSLQMSYDKAKDTYERTKQLYDAGAVALQEFENAEFSFDTVKKELESGSKTRDSDISLQQKSIQSTRNQISQQEIAIQKLVNDRGSTSSQIESANLQVRQAEIGLEQYNQQLGETVLTSPINGYISDVLVKSGENTSFGAAVVIVQSEERVISIGVPIDDYQQIKIDRLVTMEAQGTSFSGHVSMIALSPDVSSRTYVIEITPEVDDMAIGTLVEVYIPTENREDIFIPIEAIIVTDEVNYVYILEKNETAGTYTVKKAEIHAEGTVAGDKVTVTNIVPGTLIVVEGVKDIKENDIVTVVE